VSLRTGLGPRGGCGGFFLAGTFFGSFKEDETFLTELFLVFVVGVPVVVACGVVVSVVVFVAFFCCSGDCLCAVSSIGMKGKGGSREKEED